MYTVLLLNWLSQLNIMEIMHFMKFLMENLWEYQSFLNFGRDKRTHFLYHAYNLPSGLYLFFWPQSSQGIMTCMPCC